MLMYKKMRKANYKCPNWFPPEVCKLLSKILDPDSDTRISTSKIMDNCWVRKDWGTKPLNHMIETKERAALDVGASFGHNENNRMATGTKQELAKITKLNAFDIISLSAGFDLSCLLVDNGEREHFHFTSQKHALAIISKLEEIAACLRMKLMKKGWRVSKTIGVSRGRCLASAILLLLQLSSLAKASVTKYHYHGGGGSFGMVEASARQQPSASTNMAGYLPVMIGGTV
ncbi:hypothetical protein Nepgr_006877 [Nepenthes gracilis]|uniref:non-specific serine/threonine protein kinase n=1 Tax=Nepenthes gracilis TaxID=150966 RepID=A0AAD3XHR1_NEPGR|nr:hypothetical protein Nepgr_006877 [Nepenthes gracilis]